VRFRRRGTARAERGLDLSFLFNGHHYPLGLQTSWGDHTKEAPPSDLAGFTSLAMACPPAFAAQLVRSNLLSQARFVWRATRAAPKPGNLFGNRDLAPLETPWTNATTGELLSRMEWHAGLAGNAYVWRAPEGRLRVLRPDWVTIVVGSNQDPEEAAYALDGEVIGYLYTPGGNPSKAKTRRLLPEDTVHWSPIPDPLATYRGLSWLTPVLREMQADSNATEHKIKFFENAGTPNMVFTLDKGLQPDAVSRFAQLINEQSVGTQNAYRNLFLGGGADVTVVGTDLKQLDFSNVQGAGENRISVASRVPASILGIREGLQGSALNAGNFGQARRVLADSWLHPALGDVCAALQKLVKVPENAELWYDPDIPFLREDAQEHATTQQVVANTIRTLVDGGFTAESVVNALTADDLSLLVHSNLYSVQLQSPGTTAA
jgi:hypothetical protein